jgi:SAM-dependent methyltransferase
VSGHAGNGLPDIYHELAGWFHLLTHPSSYAEEAALYSRLLIDAGRRPLRTVLELGSGGGNNASHMKRHFGLTLTDVSAEMLDVSRSLNPECEHVQGDMRTLRLGRTFDALFVHDAVSYITTEEDLRAAIETAAVHCAPGGAAVFAPDYVRENFEPRTAHGGHDGEDGRALRYLEWVRELEPDGFRYIAHYAYLLKEADGSVRVVHDRHVGGAFPRELWLRLLGEAGFDATTVSLQHLEGATEGYEAFVGVRRG